MSCWLPQKRARNARRCFRTSFHRRRFGREEVAYDPWHYVPVLTRKPGALRNGAPFKDWVLPAAMEKIRRKLAGSADGDRQMVKILAAVLDDGLPAVETACAEALEQGVYSADVILNILARRSTSSSTRSMPSARPARPISRARRMKAGASTRIATTMAASPEPPSIGLPCRSLCSNRQF
jgi:hypothetical protein